MKYLITILFIILIALPVSAEKINWLHTYSGALAKAHLENKPVMIDFYADWCKWCKVLDQKTFPHKNVVAYADDFVFAKIDGEAKNNRKLLTRYQINSFPRILFLDDEGLVIGEVKGFMEGPAFAEKMTESYENWQELSELKANAKKNQNLESIFNLASIYLKSGLPEKAQEKYEFIIDEDPKNQKDFTDDSTLNLGIAHAQQSNFTKAEEHFSTYINQYFNEERTDEAYFFLGLTYMELNQTENAKEHLEKVVELYPSSPLAKQAQQFLYRMR